ncbi:MAG: glycosyltransferase family 4 protein [Candidatus Shapirobacteria bacterium]|jgi:glycosyltransferase involved in cell wall biosynthesis
MKILLISHIFPPAIDGGSKVIYKLGQYFESQNHQTLYLSSNCSSTDDFIKKSPALSREGFRKGFIKLPTYHHLRRPLKFLNLFLKQDLLKVFQKGPIFKIFPFLKATYQILKFKPDLIIAGPLPTTIILYAVFFKKITNSKLLINASFHPTDQDFQQKPLINTLKKADFLWTLTQSETDYFTKNFNIDPKKIILAGNGVDYNFLKKSKIPRLVSAKSRSASGGKGGLGSFNILFIGSLAAHKRVDILIKSFSDILASRPVKGGIEGGFKLTIAGQKTLFYSQIEKLINSLDPKLKSKINFIFNFNQKDLAKIIDNCSVLVLPSVQESFGLVIVEAWARQKPVICADIPALKELVQNSNGGLLFKTNDQSDLTKKIQEIIDNPKKSEQMGKNGYNYVKNNYTWNNVGNKICQKILC